MVELLGFIYFFNSSPIFFLPFGVLWQHLRRLCRVFSFFFLDCVVICELSSSPLSALVSCVVPSPKQHKTYILECSAINGLSRGL